MGVIRVNKTKNYTVMSNYHFKDKNLSLKAKGLLSEMLSLPDDWDYSIEGLASINKEGVKAIRNMLQELEDAGYLKRTRVRDESGRFAYIYDIFEQPQKEEKIVDNSLPHAQNGNAVPYTPFGHAVQGHAEKGRQLNTKELNTKELNTKNNKKERKNTTYNVIMDTMNLDPKLKETLIEFIKMRKLMKSPMTDHALELLIKKLEKMSSDVDVQIEILNQSIQNSWKGIFPLDKKKQVTNASNALADDYQRYSDWSKKRIREIVNSTPE